MRQVQFVIEMVGPRTVASESVKGLLHPQWANLLPEAEIFVMSGADASWRILNSADPAGAYDSVALAWPISRVSAQTAQQYWNVCEDFAKQVGRRALAIPVPQDIPATLRHLQEVRESLDIGVNFALEPVFGAFAEKGIWQVAAALGLDLSPSGCFEWRAPGAQRPLLEVLPEGSHANFSLAQAQGGATHEGLTTGFSVPVCPYPAEALDGCIHVGAVYADRLKGRFLDEDNQPVTEAVGKRMKSNLAAAVDALNRAGFPPGSAQALALFP